MKKLLPFFALLVFLLSTVESIAQQTILISSRTTHSVKEYSLAGQYLGDFVGANSGGLSRPQEVFFLNGVLLVTGRDNTAIKKYNAQTGAYLGNFTSGYALDNPTKTTIGPDGLIYVSQWGNVQNKVIRFDTTGAFVDEFTNVGVPTGMGQAWDTLGNMYVARWIDGQQGDVVRFDTAGVLIDTFLNSALLNGPVNLWIANDGNLMVADWSTGAIKKFNFNGQFLGSPYTGMNRVEGFVFDNQGNLLLCDWGANNVRKYQPNGTSTILINTGGLNNPNSITFTPTVTATLRESFQPIGITLQPNPIQDKGIFKLQIPKATRLSITLFDVAGKKMKQLFDGNLQSGEHKIYFETKSLSAGTYIYVIEADDRSYSGKVVVE